MMADLQEPNLRSMARLSEDFIAQGVPSELGLDEARDFVQARDHSFANGIDPVQTATATPAVATTRASTPSSVIKMDPTLKR